MVDKINFAWPVTSENATIYEHFKSLLGTVKDKLKGKRIVIFGAGIRGCSLLGLLEAGGFSNIIFCDNNPEKQGHLINKYDIVSPEEALKFNSEQIFLISPEDSASMSGQLKDAGLREGIDYVSFDFSAYDDYLSEYLRSVEGHMLVMGDCAFTHIALVDKETISLGDMIKSKFGQGACKVLGMHGLGQRAHYHVARSLVEGGEKPLLLLLLLVMEVLTPKAHLMPRTQHPALMRRLAEATRKPDHAFAEYAKLAEERFNRFQVESFAVSDMAAGEESEKLFMKMNYLFKIREKTEGVVYLKEILRMCNKEGIQALLYIPPVNYMQGEKFFGQQFKELYMENFTKLYGFLDSENLSYDVVDASFLLASDEFAASNTIDETSNFAGRSKILNLLVESGKIKYALVGGECL